MTIITISNYLTTIFVLVDDWHQVKGVMLLKGKAGKKPEFTDSEDITLMLVQNYIPFPNETQYVEFIRANYLDLFPKLVDQSQFKCQPRSLRLLVEQLRRDWIVQKG